MKPLPITVCILTHKSIKALPETLKSYRDNGLFNVVDEVILFVNECTTDYELNLAEEFGITHVITKDVNVGIGAAFLEMAYAARNENILLLEDDFKLIEYEHTAYKRLKAGVDLINSGYECVRYRHRQYPGYPLFTYDAYNIPDPLSKYDEEIDAYAPHLLDLIHWHPNLDLEYSDKIQSMLIDGEVWYTTTSEWANFTNNPGMYNKEFYINAVGPFAGGGISLEGSIGRFWNRSKYPVAQGPGLLTHQDEDKYNYN